MVRWRVDARKNSVAYVLTLMGWDCREPDRATSVTSLTSKSSTLDRCRSTACTPLQMLRNGLPTCLKASATT